MVSCWKELARVQGVPVHGGRSLKGGLHLPVVATGSELDLGEVGDEDEEGRRRRLHPERCESSDAIRTGRMQRARIHYLHRIIATPRVRPAQAGRTWPRGGTPAGLTRPSDAELDGPRPVEFSRSENRRPSLDRDRTAPRDQRHRWIESPEGEGASQSDDRDSTRGVTGTVPIIIRQTWEARNLRYCLLAHDTHTILLAHNTHTIVCQPQYLPMYSRRSEYSKCLSVRPRLSLQH